MIGGTMKINKKQVSAYLSEEEARILKDSAFTQTDLLKQDISGMVIGNRDYVLRIDNIKRYLDVLYRQKEMLDVEINKYKAEIEKFENKLENYDCRETEDFRKAIAEFNSVLQTNKDKRFGYGAKGFGITKIPLEIAESISKKYNISIRILLSNADEELMKNELEGYSTLLKRWKVGKLQEMKEKK